MIYHLSLTGIAGIVLSNGSLSSNTSGEGDIRKALIEADLIDCIISLPKQLFYNTGIPACLWFLSRNKIANGFRDRKGEILFINASKLGFMADRTHREFGDEDIKKIANTYHAWRSKEQNIKVDGKVIVYQDEKGYCKSVGLDEIKKHGYVLTAGRYVGISVIDDDSKLYSDRIRDLNNELESLIIEDVKLTDRIRDVLTIIINKT